MLNVLSVFYPPLVDYQIFLAGNSVELSSEPNRLSFEGYKAIDGIYLPSEYGLSELSSMTYTSLELSPWIQVDLLTNHFVYGVKIWNRCQNLEQIWAYKSRFFGLSVYHLETQTYQIGTVLLENTFSVKKTCSTWQIVGEGRASWTRFSKFSCFKNFTIFLSYSHVWPLS